MPRPFRPHIIMGGKLVSFATPRFLPSPSIGSGGACNFDNHFLVFVPFMSLKIVCSTAYTKYQVWPWKIYEDSFHCSTLYLFANQANCQYLLECVCQKGMMMQVAISAIMQKIPSPIRQDLEDTLIESKVIYDVDKTQFWIGSLVKMKVSTYHSRIYLKSS